jgi:hypothetical protein
MEETEAQTGQCITQHTLPELLELCAGSRKREWTRRTKPLPSRSLCPEKIKSNQGIPNVQIQVQKKYKLFF